MLTLQVLNGAGEWETVVRRFKSKRTAMHYFVWTMGGHKVWDGVRVL
jgi:hypothetical protein